MPHKGDMLPHEWRTLQFAPFWVFLAVAGSDGDIDEDEFQALVDVTEQYAGGTDSQEGFVQVVFSSVKEEFDLLVADFDQDDRDLIQGFADVSRALEAHVPPDESQALRAALLSLGYEIAEAEGTGIRGSQTSAEEKEALGFIVNSLDIPQEDLTTLLNQKRKRNVSGILRFLQRITWPVTAIAFLVMGIASFYWFSVAEVGSIEESVAIMISLVSFVSLPITILYGVFFRNSSLFSGARVSRALIIVLLIIPICLCCGLTILFIPA